MGDRWRQARASRRRAMPLCRPAPLNDVHPWKSLEHTDVLALEQCDCPALLEEAFRVVLGEARAVIAVASAEEDIKADWNLCKRYADLVRCNWCRGSCLACG